MDFYILFIITEIRNIRLPNSIFLYSSIYIYMYILHIFRSISTLKENFFYFLILERIFTEQITNFNEECRENYRLQDHVFTTRNVSIGFCNLLSIIAFVFHYFPLFSREERIFHPLPSFSVSTIIFPAFFSNPQNQLNETYRFVRNEIRCLRDF